MGTDSITGTVLAALERETGINLHAYPLKLEFVDGTLTIEGQVEHVMSKKRILLAAAAIPEIRHIVDRIRLHTAELMQDGEIRDRVCNALQAEHLLDTCALRAVVKGEAEVIRENGGYQTEGSIEVAVRDGVVVLNGTVWSLSHKRLAGVLAWWVPGTADVVNGLEISPPEEDNPDEVVDAVRLVLERNPFVNPSQIRVTCSDGTVVLEGLVKNATERQMAEMDAWYVFGVNGVTNLLQVEQ